MSTANAGGVEAAPSDYALKHLIYYRASRRGCAGTPTEMKASNAGRGRGSSTAVIRQGAAMA